jgi:hypothetical protein
MISFTAPVNEIASWLSGQDTCLGAARCCANCGLGLYQLPDAKGAP